MTEVEYAFEVAAVSDVGTARPLNEDHCGFLIENARCGLVAVADGVSGHEGGETASQKAIEALLRSYREQPAGVSAAKRLYRAVQQANIEVYELALVVPELAGMATTLTAVTVDSGQLTAAHVGDSRMYRVRAGKVVQLTKDHTVVAERRRLGLVSAERARTHPDKSILTRSLGRELIAAIDRISTPLERGDVIIVCSDGLYNVLPEDEMERLVRDADAQSGCQRLVEAANARGTDDNVTAAIVRMTGSIPSRPGNGLTSRLRRFLSG